MTPGPIVAFHAETPKPIGGSMSSGRVECIWIKRSATGRVGHRSGGALDPVDEASFLSGQGIEGDASFGRSTRHVTIIEKETFDRVRKILPAADPAMRRANLMISGIRLEETQGKILTVSGIRILIKGETVTCDLMDEQCPGLGQALDPHWGGGAHGIVLDDGRVRIGDEVSLSADPDEHTP